MKYFHYLLLLAAWLGFETAHAQNDSLRVNSGPPSSGYSHRDSVEIGKLGTNSGLMLAGGVGLLGAGSYLIYSGVKIHSTPAAPGSTDPAGDLKRNHSQGAAYIAGGVIGLAAGAVLIAFGIKGELEFKKRVKKMQVESGLLQNGNLGAMLTF